MNTTTAITEDKADLANKDRAEVSPWHLLVPQAVVGFVDAVSYMVTAPSIVFYILENGGSYSAYGIILASFSLSSFLFKPVLGQWCDGTGKFKVPYVTSLFLSVLGGLLYFAAGSCCCCSSSSSTSPRRRRRCAIVLIWLGRFLGGMGAASQTLGFTYVARVFPHGSFTQASSVLTLVKVLGMTVAPALNSLLGKMNFTISLLGSSYQLDVTPLNSVGLFLAVLNLISILVIAIFLEEPSPENKETTQKTQTTKQQDAEVGDEADTIPGKAVWRSVLAMDMIVPLLAVFTMNCNFQLLETALAPAANHALGYDPVQISSLFGFQALTIPIAILGTFELSRRGVSDEPLLMVGLLFGTVGYGMLYFQWKYPSTGIRFFLPMAVSCMAFPFVSATARSLYTRAVNRSPLLKHRQGTMQALLSMDASIAGFLAPAFISQFILRSPEQVEDSTDQRELGPWALYAPALSFLTLIGHMYASYCQKQSPPSPLTDDDKDTEPRDEEEFFDATEETGLLLRGDHRSGDSLVRRQQLRETQYYECLQEFTPRTRASRWETCMVMGIPQVTYEDYAEDRSSTTIRRRNTTTAGAATAPSNRTQLSSSHPETRRATAIF